MTRPRILPKAISVQDSSQFEKLQNIYQLVNPDILVSGVKPDMNNAGRFIGVIYKKKKPSNKLVERAIQSGVTLV